MKIVAIGGSGLILCGARMIQVKAAALEGASVGPDRP
jgi:hypothetical protein